MTKESTLYNDLDNDSRDLFLPRRARQNKAAVTRGKIEKCLS